eukprot:1127469-Rhodomonas_salina.1
MVLRCDRTASQRIQMSEETTGKNEQHSILCSRFRARERGPEILKVYPEPSEVRARKPTSLV